MIDIALNEINKYYGANHVMNRLEAQIDTLYHEWFAGGCG